MGKNKELKKLKGTERQIKFANDVRKYTLFQLEHAGEQGVDQKIANKVASVIKRTSNAKYILDTFAGSYYEHSILVRLDNLLNIRKRLNSAKTLKQSDLVGFSPTIKTTNYHNNDFGAYRIKDVPFDDEDAKKNEIIGRNTKILKNNFKYLKEDIAHGYYSSECEAKIANAISELRKIDYDVKKYQFELIKLVPRQYIFDINKRLDWLKYEPHTDEKIHSLADEINKYIDQLEDYNSNVRNLKPEQVQEYDIEEIDTKEYKTRLADAVKNAKKYSEHKSDENNDEKTYPSFTDDHSYSIGDTLIVNNLAVQVVSVEKHYYSDDDIERMESMGTMEPGNYAGNYYYIYYKNISDTEKGKKMLQVQHEKDAKKAAYRKTKKEFEDFVRKYRTADNYVDEDTFAQKYLDDFEKANIIYGSYWHNKDYYSLNKNLFFMAGYNGLSGDNWDRSTYASYIVWVAKLTDEQADKVKHLASKLTKFENDD